MKGAEPIVAIMRPPPLWRDSDYGMNQTILNDVMPRLVPEISTLASSMHTLPDSTYHMCARARVCVWVGVC